MIRKAYCWLETKFLRTFVDQPTDWLVRAIEYTVGSKCKYCMTLRGFTLGLGLALTFSSPLLSLLLTGVALGIKWLETKYSCYVQYEITVEYPIPAASKTVVLVCRTGYFPSLAEAQEWAATEMRDVPYTLREASR
jgi:hypothetical protein